MPTQITVAEIVLDRALERWWDGDSLGCDRFHLLQNLGAVHPAKYNRWGWKKLPREIKLLLVNHAMNGKPLEYLEREWDWS